MAASYSELVRSGVCALYRLALVNMPDVCTTAGEFWTPRADNSGQTAGSGGASSRTMASLQSPATKVPRHGTNFLGQTYGVDLIFSPNGQNCPTSESSRSGLRPPEDFPSFGETIFAAADGTVVRVHDAERDQNSRSGRKALRFLKFEQFVRALGPPGRVLGNHLIVRLPDGPQTASAAKTPAASFKPRYRKSAATHVALRLKLSRRGFPTNANGFTLTDSQPGFS